MPFVHKSQQIILPDANPLPAIRRNVLYSQPDSTELAIYKYQMEYFYRRTRHRTHTFQFVLFNLNVKVFMPLCLCIQQHTTAAFA